MLLFFWIKTSVVKKTFRKLNCCAKVSIWSLESIGMSNMYGLKNWRPSPQKISV